MTDQETVEGITVTMGETRSDTYPRVTKCPSCGSGNGYQSFDIWVCQNCGKWPYIEPIKSEKVDG